MERFRNAPAKFFLAVAVLSLAAGACSTTKTGSSADTTASGAASQSSDTSSSASDQPSAVHAATIKRFEVHPQQLAVKVGTSVTWTNNDEILHTITAGTPAHRLPDFNGQMPTAGSTFTYKFVKPGSYKYFCLRHPTVDALKGIVVVS